MGLIVKIVVLAAWVGCCSCDLIRFPDRDDVNVRQGREVTLECRIPPGQPTDGSFTPWSGPQSAFDSGRVITHSNRRRSTLRIRNVCASDEGTYRCTYSNGEEAHFNVIVQRRASFLSCPPVQNFTSDTDMVVVCTVDLGNPPASVHWSKANTPLNGERYTPMVAGLHISSIQLEDSGVYHCELDQEGYGAQSCAITVEVLPPEGEDPPSIAEMNPVVTVKHGDPLDLECILEAGEENATIMWTTPSTVIQGSSLHVGNPSPGIYNCIAQNPWGLDVFLVNVTVNIPPLPSMSNRTVETTVGFNVTLPCDTDLPPNPPPTFTWQRHSDPASRDFPHEPSTDRIAVKTNGHLRIHPVAAGDGGVYQCIVENECGRSVQLVELVVIPPPPPTTPPPPPGTNQSTDPKAFIALLVEERCEDLESSGLAEDLRTTLERCECGDLNVEEEALECLGGGRGRFTAFVAGPQAESAVRRFNDSVESGEVGTVGGASVSLCDSECYPTAEPEEEEEGEGGALVAVAVVMSVVAVALLGITVVVLVCLLRVFRNHKQPCGSSIEEGSPPSLGPQQNGQYPGQSPPPPYCYVSHHPTMVPCQHMALNCPLHPMQTVAMCPQPGTSGRTVQVPCYLPMRSDPSHMPQQATPS